jgi:hypothetical protein
MRVIDFLILIMNKELINTIKKRKGLKLREGEI